MNKLTSFEKGEKNLINLRQASEWASCYLNRKVTISNISYLLQYGRITKYGNSGNLLINKEELKTYYGSYNKEKQWKKILGKDLNWHLSFVEYKESERTKHVHRLHPYKGKFIPQLVEYFLDNHKDNFKKEVYFKNGDIVLDPFCGSGTALVQANELGMHAIGVDISAFNSLITNIKVGKYNRVELQNEFKNITYKLKAFIANSETVKFENELLTELAKFNNKFFPAPEFRYKVNRGQINEYVYGKEKEKEFLPIFLNLVNDHKIRLKQEKADNFIDKWYLQHIRNEIDFVADLIKQIKGQEIKDLVTIILSRTVRSCRATTHSDLATLKEPVTQTYYCSKHGKICKPLFSIFNWWGRYSIDTVQRIEIFNKLRTDTYQICLTGDARTIDITEEVGRLNPEFAEILRKQKIQGIFSSPPYVGLIDYHEQHAYAYDLFGFKRRDDLEIGPLSKGQGSEARISYVHDIAEVLKNCKNFLANDYNVFLVANDKYNIYPQIAEESGMRIVNQYKRPVLNRTEKDKGAYSEIIFHLKQK